jgi:hypothetical protein
MHTTATDVQPQPLVRELRPVWVVSAAASAAALIATIALTAVSLFAPLSAADTATSTKLTLAAGHILAAAIIIPPVTWRLTRR